MSSKYLSASILVLGAMQTKTIAMLLLVAIATIGAIAVGTGMQSA
jgi:hypothetical protein